MIVDGKQLLQPKKITIEDKEYIVSKVSAFDAIPLFKDLSWFAGDCSADPLVEQARKEKLREAFSYCGVELDGKFITFTTKALIDSHVPAGTDHVLFLLKAFVEYNTEFLKKKEEEITKAILQM